MLPGVSLMAYQEPEFLPWDGRRVPITFVGGYLGSGKTTVINDVIAHADRPIAVIVNDVGSINIDAKLIRKRRGDMIEVTNGCVCCSSIDGMGTAFDQIRSRPEPPDHVLVELSGVAEPSRMIPWGQSAGFMLDGVVVVVATDQLLPGALPDWIQQQLCAQIIDANLLVLMKADLVDTVSLANVRKRLAELAPSTPVFHGRSDLAGVGAVGRFLALGGRRSTGSRLTSASTLFDAHQTHVVTPPEPLTLAGLHAWLDELPNELPNQLPAQLSNHPQARIVRAKGILATADAGLVLVQIVGSRREVSSVPAPEHQPPTDLVVITLDQ
jgi:G3E family GTPase